MAIDVIMPAFEMAQDSALLVRWLKKEGEQVVKGDVLMEVETDKATVEVEATGSGILSRVTAHDGEQVPVGKVIAVLLDGASVLVCGTTKCRLHGLTPQPKNQASQLQMKSRRTW